MRIIWQKRGKNSTRQMEIKKLITKAASAVERLEKTVRPGK